MDTAIREADLTLNVPRFHVQKGADGSGHSTGDFVIEGFASTNEIDSFSEVVEPRAFQESMERFMEFPILLFSHRFDEPVGTVIRASIEEDEGLFIEARISGATGRSEAVRKQINEGILRAFSIGFMVTDHIYDKDLEVNRITGLELLEISVVALPANRGSTFEMAKSLKTRLAVPAVETVDDSPQTSPDADEDHGTESGGETTTANIETTRVLAGMIRGMVPTIAATGIALGSNLSTMEAEDV